MFIGHLGRQETHLGDQGPQDVSIVDHISPIHGTFVLGWVDHQVPTGSTTSQVVHRAPLFSHYGSKRVLFLEGGVILTTHATTPGNGVKQLIKSLKNWWLKSAASMNTNCMCCWHIPRSAMANTYSEKIAGQASRSHKDQSLPSWGMNVKKTVDQIVPLALRRRLPIKKKHLHPDCANWGASHSVFALCAHHIHTILGTWSCPRTTGAVKGSGGEPKWPKMQKTYDPSKSGRFISQMNFCYELAMYTFLRYIWSCRYICEISPG